MTKELGIAPLPVEGMYFVRLDEWMKGQSASSTDFAQQRVTLYEKLSISGRFPWKTVKYPELVVWFERNEIPLKLVHEAVQRPHYYRPLIVESNSLNSSGMLSAIQLPDLKNYPEMARLLCSRAMWHLGEGRIAAAQQDLLDCHRLARHVGRDGSGIGMLLTALMESLAMAGEAHLVVDPQLTAEQARFYRLELKKLGPSLTYAEFAQIIDQEERFLGLDSVVGLATHQIVGEDLPIGGTAIGPVILETVQRMGVNWNIALQKINSHYDDCVMALLLPDRVARLQAVEDIHKQLQDEMHRISRWQSGFSLILGGGSARGRALATVLLQGFVFLGESHLNSFDAATTCWQIAQVGFALAEYRRIHGRYPERLEELQPEFIEQIPDDIFSGASLIYQVDPSGLEMKLYSVGRNGVDDGGIRSSEDSPTGEDGDDIGFLDPIPVFPVEAAEPEETEAAESEDSTAL